MLDAAGGEADRVRYRQTAGAPMRDYGQPAQPEQIRASIGIGIETLAEPARGRPDQQTAELGPSAGGDLVSQGTEDSGNRPFERLENDVAGEAVANDHVGGPFEQVAAFGVAPEVEVALLDQQAMRLERQLVSLLRLLADREQAHLRSEDAQDLLREDGAHVRELPQVLRTAVGIRARVDQHRGAAPRRENNSDRRPVDTAQAADFEQAGCQHRTRVSRRDGGVGSALTDETAGDNERAVALRAHGFAGLLVHRDRRLCLDELQAARVESRWADQHRRDLR